MISDDLLAANLPEADSPAVREAFDAAWQVLEQRGSIAPDNFYALRAQLGRQILRLALAGENDPAKLSSYAVSLMRL